MIEPYYQDDSATIYHGDCLEILPTLEPVDLVLTDPPYGITACEWDSVIDLKLMWGCLDKVTADNTPIVLMASQPFTTVLISSNMKMFKYEWIWEKSKATGFMNAKKQPMKNHENILLFYGLQCAYNPQMKKAIYIDKRKQPTKAISKEGSIYGQNQCIRNVETGQRYPSSVVEFNNSDKTNLLHPTQKPIKLMQYLIKTYSNKGDTVLDFAMGSGTTLRAAKDLGRKAIGIEIEEKYCEIAAKRLAQEVLPL